MSEIKTELNWTGEVMIIEDTISQDRVRKRELGVKSDLCLATLLSLYLSLIYDSKTKIYFT